MHSFKESDGIELVKTNRGLAKICLNSMWGKL
jgi:hypothetical protein